MYNRKLWGTILGILAFIALIAGLTYAWYTWRSNNVIINGTSGCFTILYTNGPDIGNGTEDPASIDMSSTYMGGLSTTVSMGVSTSCNITGTGTIYLYTNTTGTSSVLLSEGALKYAVVASGSVVSSGSITSAALGNDIPIYNNFNLSSGAVTYTVYVWLDGTIADNDYVDTTYSGYIHASAVQTVS